jgi:hypothetical protein
VFMRTTKVSHENFVSIEKRWQLVFMMHFD